MTEALEAALRRKRSKHDRRVGEARSLAQRLRGSREEISALEARREALEQAIEVFNSFADERQQQVQAQLETLVTEGLHAVFGEGLSFHVSQGMKGKTAQVDFFIRSTTDGHEIDTPVMEARGGGVAAVVGFLVRLVLLLLKSDVRRVLFLDESFAQLSAEYEPRLAEFMRELIDRTGAQIVLVTHSDAFSDAADAIYRTALVDGVTEITREK